MLESVCCLFSVVYVSMFMEMMMIIMIVIVACKCNRFSNHIEIERKKNIFKLVLDIFFISIFIRVFVLLGKLKAVCEKRFKVNCVMEIENEINALICKRFYKE